MLRMGAALALVVSVTGCSEPFVAPTTREECARAVPDADRGSTDVSPSWSIAYSDEPHPLGTSGVLHLCVPADVHATVTTDPLPGVEVRPEPLLVRPGGGVPELVVTVSDGDDEEDFHVHYDSPGEDGTQWVEIHVEGDEWSFQSWRR